MNGFSPTSCTVVRYSHFLPTKIITICLAFKEQCMILTWVAWMTLTCVTIIKTFLGQADSMLTVMMRTRRCFLVEKRNLRLHLTELSWILVRTHAWVASLPMDTLSTMLAQLVIRLAVLSDCRAVVSCISWLAGAMIASAALIFHTGASIKTKVWRHLTWRYFLLAECSPVSVHTLTLVMLDTETQADQEPFLIFPILTYQDKMLHSYTCVASNHQCSPHTFSLPSLAHSHTYNTIHHTNSNTISNITWTFRHETQCSFLHSCTGCQSKHQSYSAKERICWWGGEYGCEDGSPGICLHGRGKNTHIQTVLEHDQNVLARHNYCLNWSASCQRCTFLHSNKVVRSTGHIYSGLDLPGHLSKHCLRKQIINYVDHYRYKQGCSLKHGAKICWSGVEEKNILLGWCPPRFVSTNHSLHHW